MPAKDIYHDAVKNALIKDGWIITDDPYFIKYEDAELYADLSAEKPIAAEREGKKIVVEVKSFVGKSLMYDFHGALGQYIVYRNLIQLTEPEYTLYLAIDCLVYEDFFQRKYVQAVIKDNRVFLIVVDSAKEELVKWLTNENYRLIIKRILTEYYDLKIHQGQKNAECEVSDRLALDEIRDEYLWFRFGWKDRKLVQHIIIYLRIKDSKVWVEQDLTNFCIVDDLLAAGIPQTDIVLGFHHPSKRPFTEFAIA